MTSGFKDRVEVVEDADDVTDDDFW